MNQNHLARWGYFAGFVVLAAISCMATEHSLYLLLPNLTSNSILTQIILWAITVSFFVISSYGAKLIIEAATSEYVENRKRSFWCGSLLVLFFWVLFSLPTNTHSFFYQQKIGDIALEDIENTDLYLAQISNQSNHLAKYDTVTALINEQLTLASNEFHGRRGSRSQGHRGDGEWVRTHIDSINKILQKENVAEIPYSQGFNQYYQDIIAYYNARARRSLDIVRRNYLVSDREKNNADSLRITLAVLQDTISTMNQMANIGDDVIFQTQSVLNNAYSNIKKNHPYIVFANQQEKEKFTAENPESKTKRMLSYINTWYDYFSGKHPQAFLIYFLFSILIDLGAFLMFYLAFRKTY